MFATNGNRRPKPALKMTCTKTPSVLRDIQRLLDQTKSQLRSSYRPHHSLDDKSEKQIVDFRETHANKHLIAFQGNEIKNDKGVVEVEISLYALPKGAVQKIERPFSKAPIVHLRSNFFFEDEVVGMRRDVTLLVDDCQKYHAFEVDQEARDAMAGDTSGLSRLGRFPYVMNDGKLHVALPLASHNTRKDYLAKQEETMTPRIILKPANSRSRGRIEIEDATRNINKPRKANVTADIDVQALPDGRYRAIRDGIHLWLVKSSFKVGVIAIDNILLLPHDYPSINDVALKELPEEAKAEI